MGWVNNSTSDFRYHFDWYFSLLQVVDIMEDRVGVPLKVVVKRPKDVTITLTVIPEEAYPNM